MRICRLALLLAFTTYGFCLSFDIHNRFLRERNPLYLPGNLLNRQNNAVEIEHGHG